MVRRTKEEALATRHRLLDAAEVLFQSQGVSQTTLQQIAQEAGATRGAIYWHFKDKPDLFNAMMERVTLPLESATREASAANEDPLAAIEQVMVQALSLMTTDPQVRRVFEVATLKVEYTDEMAPVLQRHRSARNECVADFVHALQHAASRAGIELPIPAKTAAYGLHAVISGLIQDWLLEPGRLTSCRRGGICSMSILRGLGFERRAGWGRGAAKGAA
ncbi:TetR family transcriptional regulator [Variovorax sp. WS11]|uniref:TetR family transcriptional regulator n=1 Tax=Variovorax sp. WS11 TaxID=1105204 RepID=UPI0013DA96A1|nr:TetR family transcriptional regulator [Variovorax sp. WS11]